MRLLLPLLRLQLLLHLCNCNSIAQLLQQCWQVPLLLRWRLRTVGGMPLQRRLLAPSSGGDLQVQDILVPCSKSGEMRMQSIAHVQGTPKM